MTHINDTTGSGPRISTTVPDAVLQPVSRHRIMDALERLGYAYFVDSDAEISGVWDHGRFYFSVAGHKDDIFSVSGFWSGYLPADRRPQLLETCNRWNREHYMPKAEVTVDGDGDQHIVVEHSVDYEFGVTDEQLNQQIVSTVGPGNAFFRLLTQDYPEGVPD